MILAVMNAIYAITYNTITTFFSIIFAELRRFGRSMISINWLINALLIHMQLLLFFVSNFVIIKFLYIVVIAQLD